MEKQRRLELKYVGNCVAKAVLVDSANQFSLEELCRTQYNLTYFSKRYRQSDPLEKTLMYKTFRNCNTKNVYSCFSSARNTILGRKIKYVILYSYIILHFVSNYKVPQDIQENTWIRGSSFVCFLLTFSRRKTCFRDEIA